MTSPRNPAEPVVSVVMPCYNQGHLLDQAITSVLGQSYKNWELLVVNDGSTDATAEVGQRQARGDRRIQCISQENRGLAAARNTGISSATGEYLVFLDADDLLHPDALRWQVDAVRGQENAIGLLKYLHFTYDPETDGVSDSHPRQGDCFLPNLLTYNFAPPLCYMCSRASVLAAGLFEENDKSLKGCEDWDLWLRLALRGARLVRIPHVGAYYRRYEGSMSTDLTRMRVAGFSVLMRAYWRLMHKEQYVAGLSPEVFAACKELAADRVRNQFAGLIRDASGGGRPLTALRALLASVRCCQKVERGCLTALRNLPQGIARRAINACLRRDAQSDAAAARAAQMSSEAVRFAAMWRNGHAT